MLLLLRKVDSFVPGSKCFVVYIPGSFESHVFGTLPVSQAPCPFPISPLPTIQLEEPLKMATVYPKK